MNIVRVGEISLFPTVPRIIAPCHLSARTFDPFLPPPFKKSGKNDRRREREGATFLCVYLIGFFFNYFSMR